MKRKQLGSIGDVNAAEYGGGIIFETEHGPYLEYTHGLETEASSRDLCTFEEEEAAAVPMAIYGCHLNDVANNLDWADLDDIANCHGIDRSELEAARDSTDPLERAWYVGEVAGYHGWQNVDSYPLELTYAEVEERWATCTS